MRFPLFGGDNTAPSTSAAQYNAINACFASSWNSTENDRSIPVPEAFDLSNLYVEIASAPGTGKSYTFTVMKNGSATSLAVTISDSNVSGTDNSHTVSFAAGDTISMECTPSGTPSAPGNQWWNMMLTTSSQSFPILGKSNNSAPTSGDGFANIMGGYNLAWETSTEGNVQIVVPTAGTIKNLYAKLNGTPGAGKSYQVTVMKNGSAQSLTTTISNSNTTGNDTTHNFSVAAGDKLSIKSTASGTPSARQISWGVEFDPDVNGESFIGFGSSQVPAADATNYEQILSIGNNSWLSSPEANRHLIPYGLKFTKMYVLLGTAPGVGNSRTIAIRNNGSDTGLIVTIPNTDTTGNVTASVTPAQGDKFTLQSSISGTPAALTGGVHIGLLIKDDVTTNSERAAKVAGRDTANDSRSAKITGKDTSTSERSAKITGQDTSNSERSAKLTGQATDNSERPAKISGIDTASNERSAKVVGQDTANSERGATLTGTDGAHAERGAKIVGYEVANAERPAEITGKDSASSDRSAKLTGKASDSTERAAKVTGVDGATSERSAKIAGIDTANVERAAKTTGKDTAQDSRDAKIVGIAQAQSERAAKITGKDTSQSERDAKITGGENVASERSASITGTPPDVVSLKRTTLTQKGTQLRLTQRSSQTNLLQRGT